MKQANNIFGLLLILLFAIGCASEIDPEKERVNLLDTDRQFAETSIEKGAAEAFRMYLAVDALQLPAGAHPIEGGENIYQGMRDMPKGAILEWEPRDAQVARSGELGWTWGNYVFSFQDSAGELKKSYGKYLNIWKKQNGQWQVLVDMGNQSPKPL